MESRDGSDSLDGLDDVRNFSVGIAFENQTVGESNWAVFGNEEGVIVVSTTWL